MKTIRVRISVAVDESGCYSCAGWTQIDSNEVHDKETRNAAMDFLSEPNGAEAFYIVEADIPLPASETIKGTVIP